MEKHYERIGGVSALDGQGRPHRFDTLRDGEDYRVLLDGEVLCAGCTLRDAISLIREEGARRGYRRKGA